MKMIKVKTFKMMYHALLIMLMSLVITSCAKDGAPGPKGDEGAQGEQGAQGDQGEQGKPGNANVMASAWIPIEFGTASAMATSFNVTDPNLTQEIIDTGLILVYGKQATSNQVYSLPFTYSNEWYFFDIEENDIEFVARSVDKTEEVYEFFEKVRYVIVPSSATTGGRMQNVDYSQMSYEEVMDHFNLEY